jgi:hypothetical protein
VTVKKEPVLRTLVKLVMVVKKGNCRNICTSTDKVTVTTVVKTNPLLAFTFPGG